MISGFVYFVKSVYNLVNILNDRARVKTRGGPSFYEAHNFIISLNVQKAADEIPRGNLNHYARYTRKTTERVPL